MKCYSLNDIGCVVCLKVRMSSQIPKVSSFSTCPGVSRSLFCTCAFEGSASQHFWNGRLHTNYQVLHLWLCKSNGMYELSSFVICPPFKHMRNNICIHCPSFMLFKSAAQMSQRLPNASHRKAFMSAGYLVRGKHLLRSFLIKECHMGT